MATKVSAEGNYIKIDEGSTPYTYFNTKDLTMEFTDHSSVILTSRLEGSRKEVLFSDFQDGTGTPVNTEATIAVYVDGLW
jgi:hypothetical protein